MGQYWCSCIYVGNRRVTLKRATLLPITRLSRDAPTAVRQMVKLTNVSKGNELWGYIMCWSHTLTGLRICWKTLSNKGMYWYDSLPTKPKAWCKFAFLYAGRLPFCALLRFFYKSEIAIAFFLDEGHFPEYSGIRSYLLIMGNRGKMRESGKAEQLISIKDTIGPFIG